MKPVSISLTGLLISVFCATPAMSYFHASGGHWNYSGYRGTASGGDGSWSATNRYGTTAYGGDHYYGGTYSGYHPPTVVNSYYGGGCYGCGGWDAAGAAAAGAVVGAAVGTVAAETANANAYTAGYAAGTAAGVSYAMGAIYATLPAGAMLRTVNGATYYVANGVWFSSSYGANGVYYRVVPAP